MNFHPLYPNGGEQPLGNSPAKSLIDKALALSAFRQAEVTRLAGFLAILPEGALKERQKELILDNEHLLAETGKFILVCKTTGVQS